MRTKLKLVSYLAPNSFWLFEAIAAQCAYALGVEVQIWQGNHTPLEDPLLYSDQWDLAFICGLPLVLYNRTASSPLRAFAAPVMQGDRYRGHPVYFSDVIVRANDPAVTFADLRGRTFCFNDPGSNSGYNLMGHRLRQDNLPPSFFGRAIASGSHQRSIQWVSEGMADCAAIDSTVLEQALRDAPALSGQIKVLDSIGPCPMPPIVAAPHVNQGAIALMQRALLNPDTALQQTLVKAQIQRYASVQTDDYAPIAAIYDAALADGYACIG